MRERASWEDGHHKTVSDKRKQGKHKVLFFFFVFLGFFFSRLRTVFILKVRRTMEFRE